ncbi:MAG TPA: tetratricopeptide repeat protein, partial [Thermoanaerobaculia bacterium]|nr:tetratricopeptide repeat protein [Thermoanaerobaculia bacterium]
PQNIFLTQDGAKILDFGLARNAPAERGDLSAADTASALTEAGAAMGTVGYMSPEQARGEPIGPSSDVWSFGCVLYEMLAGRRAFAGRNATETLAAVLTKEPEWQSLAPGVAPDFRDFIARCLRKDPEQRPRDVAGAARALEGSTPALSALETANVSAAGRAAPRLRRLAIAAGFAAAAAAIALLLWRRPAPIDSLAVLPFSSAGSDAELADLCASLSDSVISRISQAPNLRVMASSAVARFAGANVDPLAAARELGVRAILTGRAVGRSSRVSISAELVDARDGRHLWGERYDRPLETIAALPPEIASAVAAKLHLRLSGEDRVRLARKETESREAYELWLRGRQFWASGRRESDLEKGLGYFEKALEADPGYARAWTGIAETWDVFGYTHRRPVPDAYEKAKAAARKALELDPDLADAHAVLAHATMMTGDPRAAEQGFRRALELDGNSLNALHWYSHLLMTQKRWDESLALSQRLLELDPLGWWNVHLGEHYRAKGDRALALQHFRRAVDLDHDNAAARWQFGRALLEDGRTDEAVTELETARRLDPESSDYRLELAAAYEKAGRTADAARLRALAAGAKP